MKKKKYYKIFVSPGDPAGVGIEILIKAISKINLKNKQITIGTDPDFFIKNIELFVKDKKKSKEIKEFVKVEEIYRIKSKKKEKEEAKFSLISLDWAIEKAKKEGGILFTGPVSKGKIRKIKRNFKGQTEYIAEKVGIEPENIIMSFYFKDKFIGLFSQHIPLREVFLILEPERYIKRLNIFQRELKKILKRKPRIALLSLNPHSEEFGREEIELKKYIRFNKYLKGFFAPDSFFGYGLYKNFDGIFAFYHDQGTIPAKILGPSVHISLGLPFIRVSPDHGPAFNKKGKADFSSTLLCFRFIEKLIKKYKHQ